MIELLEGQVKYCKREADKYYKASEVGALTIAHHQGRGIRYRLGPKVGFARTAVKMLNREIEFRAQLIKLRHCDR